jgi:pyruvate/2-oxoglutarate dehydrogenase complex dihydrolipoamide dehydrogenase (E3) component
VADRIRDEATDDSNDQVAVDRFTAKGGRSVRGSGRLVGSGTVEVDGERLGARRAVVLATGTKPVIPPIAGLSDTPYWTNREAIEAKMLPASLLVLGGGAVGLELAQAFVRWRRWTGCCRSRSPSRPPWRSPRWQPTASPCGLARVPPPWLTTVTSSR